MPSTILPKKAAVLGHPALHSLSPRLHGYWLRQHGIAGDYVAMDITPEALAATLKNLRGLGLAGVNLTVPHKEAALPIVDRLDETARLVGAVNLVVLGADGGLDGRNTDVYGFAENLKSAGWAKIPGHAVVLGAGGAARGVIAALAQLGFDRIVVVNRTRGRAERLAEAMQGIAQVEAADWEKKEDALAGAALLVNTTALGMKGQPELDIALDALPKQATVTDIVYVPLQTDLLRQAAARGYRTVDGLGMLLHQARPSFAAFFGVMPDVTADLRRSVLEGMGS
jgi:shikimate dehydrogenase